MDVDHGVPILLRGLEQRAIAQDAGVVHQDVDAAEGIDGGGDDRRRGRRLADRLQARHRLAAGGADLGDHALGVGAAATHTVAIDTGVVHHHAGAFAGEQQRVLAPDAVASSGDDRNLAVEDSHLASSSGSPPSLAVVSA